MVKQTRVVFDLQNVPSSTKKTAGIVYNNESSRDKSVDTLLCLVPDSDTALFVRRKEVRKLCEDIADKIRHKTIKLSRRHTRTSTDVVVASQPKQWKRFPTV